MYKSQNYKEIENIKYKPRQKRNNSKMKTIKKRVIPKKNKDYQAIKTVKAVRQNYDKDDTEDNQQFDDEDHESNLQIIITLGIFFLIILGVSVYIFAIVRINGNRGTDVSHLRNAKQLSKPQQSDKIYNIKTNTDKKLIQKIPSQSQNILTPTKKFQPAPSELIQKCKKLTTQISVQKVIRAHQFLKNITQPIDQKYLKQQKAQYQRDYQIFKYNQKPICIVIPTFNNIKQDRYKKNIDSILNQQYKNYKVIIIDDASPDRTGSQIERYISGHPVYLDGRIKIQINKQRKMALPNILDAAHNYCQPEDIFIVIDGDDYLLGKHVFKLFNAAYSNSDIWVVYSNFLDISGRIGYSRRYPLQIIEKNYFRKVVFLISHLRSFYTKLLYQIKKQDLLDKNGQYFHAANDVSIFMPVMQMARDRILYLPQINYYYNSNTGLNNHQQKKQQQIRNDKYVRSKPSYSKIDKLFSDYGDLRNDLMQ